MNLKRLKTLGLTLLAAAAAFPAAAHAQLGRIDFGFDLGRNRGVVTYEDGRYGVTYHYGSRAYRGYRFDVVDFIPVNGVRVPRRFRPGHGFCRLWLPGVAPRRQPHAVRCASLVGPFGDGVLVVTSRGVLRPVWDRTVSRHWRGYRDARFRSHPRGRAHWYDRDDFWWDERYDDWREDQRDRWEDWDDDRRDRWEDEWERRYERDEDRYDRRDRRDRRDRAERRGRGQGRDRPGRSGRRPR